MSLVKGTVHGFASMTLVVLGAVLTDVIRQNIELFEQISELTVQLLVDVGNIPISKEVASIVIPVGILMGIWVFLYEIKQATT